MKKSVPHLAKTVQRALELEGVHTHWDDAHTTGSVYLDLDHGVLGSIRVSDHKGRGNGYLFEIGSHIDSPHTVDKTIMGQTYSVRKFPALSVPELVEAVMIRRLHLKSKTGNLGYRRAVDSDAGRYEHPIHT